MKIQYDNATKRILNVGQEPWANQDDYPDSTIIEVLIGPPDPYYDYIYDVEGEQYDFDEWQEHPARLASALDAIADSNLDDLVDRLKTAGMFEMSVTEVFDDIQGRVDALASLADAKVFLRQVIPFLVAGVIWIIRRLLRRT